MTEVTINWYIIPTTKYVVHVLVCRHFFVFVPSTAYKIWNKYTHHDLNPMKLDSASDIDMTFRIYTFSKMCSFIFFH